MWQTRLMAPALVTAVLLSSTAAQEITPGVPDTFEDFETNGYWGWRNGLADLEALNLAVVGGGIGGANDHYLQVTSGLGFRARLVTLNRSQWIGDYVTPGITAISMDLRLFNGTTRSMRIAFLEQEGGQFSPAYVSQPFTLPNDGQWHHAEFSLSTLTPVNNPHPLNELLSNTDGILKELRIYSAAGLTILGDLADLRVGIDNITAVAPTPHPGDFDGDGDVDGADFVAWQTNFPKASGATLDQGDADGDGDVDGADFVVWQTNFPFTPSPGGPPVPEPPAWISILVAGGFLAIHFRRHRCGMDAIDD